MAAPVSVILAANKLLLLNHAAPASKSLQQINCCKTMQLYCTCFCAYARKSTILSTHMAGCTCLCHPCSKSATVDLYGCTCLCHPCSKSISVKLHSCTCLCHPSVTTIKLMAHCCNQGCTCLRNPGSKPTHSLVIKAALLYVPAYLLRKQQCRSKVKCDLRIDGTVYT